jgi:hypothetical protein
MATRSKAKSPAPSFGNAKFINYSLSNEQKAEIKSTEWTLDDFDNALTRLSEAMYKITFAYDDYAECYSAHLVPKGSEHVNAGYILAGRGSTPHKALKQAVYMHYFIFEENWSEFYVSRGREELDD